ncbi:MAG: T9SS type A sorting domain-containing protein [Bacteroidetes bacterium]|nr:T9SS type A sorting domain-containing protein [Bacteroidota bacterium]
MNDFLSYSHWIGKFTDKELTAEEENSLIFQASYNPLLRNELRLDNDLNELFSDPEVFLLSETIRKTIIHERNKVRTPVYLKIAASVIILITLAGLAGFVINYSNHGYRHALLAHEAILKSKDFFGLIPGSDNRVGALTPVQRRAIIQYGQKPDSYTPRPEFEFLVGTVTRDVSVFVISPMPRVKSRVDSTIYFSWRWLAGPMPLNLEITDNLGHVVLNYMQLTDLGYALNTKHWARGLYYYKITTGDEIITIGSISIY